MADVTIPANTAVNLYTASGIDAGAQLRVTHLGGNDIRLSVTEAELFTNHINVGQRQSALNTAGDLTAFAWSNVAGALNVREV